MGEQILWGSLFLGWCIVLHVTILAFSIPMVVRLVESAKRWSSSGLLNVMVILMMTTSLVFSHTLQVWGWAGFFLRQRALETWNEAIYFSLVTYTSLGYGDVVVGPAHRIFAAFGSVTGLLAFGLSTAVLVAVMTQILRDLVPGFSNQSSGEKSRARGAP
ncbi:MAG: potassium channel family protein [Pseudomonadota bacterium]